MADDKEYYQYIQGYNEYDGNENSVDKDFPDKHPLYKNIPYYNNEIKSLQDINKNYQASEDIDNAYYEDNPQYNNYNDVNLIYNDGYPSYRMVNPPSPRVVDLVQKVTNSNSSIASDHISNVGSSRTENIKVSEISKLTEAIKELTSRLPVPPSPELLKSVHPNLAVKLQLTYLKAYIQNQQLLLDLKSNLEVPYSSSEFPKYSQNMVTQTSDVTDGPNVHNYPIVELRGSYPQISTTSMNGQNNLGHPQLADEHSYGNNFLDYVQNLPLNQFNCPQLTNYPNFYYPLNNQPNFSLPQLTNYPQVTNYPQLTNYPHLSGRSNYRYTGSNYENGNYERSYKDDGEYIGEGFKDAENPALLVPAEYRDRVKYNAPKKAFVSVYLNSLGLRKRKSFSINKFGLNKALKLSINFSNQLTLINTKNGKNDKNGSRASDGKYFDMEQFDTDKDNFRLALRERNLIEDVCEHALSMNSKSVEDFELFEKALKMDRIRGLVYSLGANVWICIFYKKRKRKMQCFSVQEFGFEKCYQMGQTFFNNNSQVVRSKLSGVLSYWLESIPTKTLVIIFKIKASNLISQINTSGSDSNDTVNLTKATKSGSKDDSYLYMGRFELDVYGGFLPAKRASQAWCNYLKKYPNQDFKVPNGINGTKEPKDSSNMDGNLLKLGFVYYDDYNKLWVVVNGSERVQFSADTLGHLESKKQAITLRQQHIIENKLNNM